MNLHIPTTQHLNQIMSWINNEQELLQWAGPGFHYPFELKEFREDLKLSKLQSYCLLSKSLKLLGFGQYYLRLNRCHLGRLIINPDYRGQGLITNLVEQLCHLGCSKLAVTECSLFVLSPNKAALRAYQRLGFKQVPYPKKLDLDNCLYMTK